MKRLHRLFTRRAVLVTWLLVSTVLLLISIPAPLELLKTVKGLPLGAVVYIGLMTIAVVLTQWVEFSRSVAVLVLVIYSSALVTVLKLVSPNVVVPFVFAVGLIGFALGLLKGRAAPRARSAVPAPNPSVVAKLMGVRIDSVRRAELLARIVNAVEFGSGGMISNVNVHALNIAWKDPEFRSILNRSDLVFVDGFGAQLGARLSHVPIGERLTPADWIDELFAICAQRRWSIFWLGDSEQVGIDFERELVRRHPACLLAGRHHGFFEKTGAENDAVVNMLNQSGAQIVLVGMGMPLQEKWISANRHRLIAPVHLSVGGLARIYTGVIPRGPRWMTDNGLEWLYRLAMQPRHTWRRYVIGNPLFLTRLVLIRMAILKTPE
jgi:N-acetylglucosaminyldiphosphoundecaprenol N-acetyl-beta-D-mannosaminyltransferase